MSLKRFCLANSTTHKQCLRAVVLYCQDRMDVEAAAMQLLHRCCPAHVPQLLLYDASSSVLAMQYLPPPHQKLLYAIRQGQVRYRAAAVNMDCA
jgi:5-methylthioribose kinase